jgi:hypothetical protein
MLVLEEEEINADLIAPINGLIANFWLETAIRYWIETVILTFSNGLGLQVGLPKTVDLPPER